MKRDRLFHIMRYLHFENNKNPTDRTSPDYYRLYKNRRVFNYLNNKYSTFYNPTEYLVVEDVIVKFKGRAGFRQYVPKNKKFGIKLYELCDSMITWLIVLVNNGRMLLKVSPLHMEKC
jgi:hypothetical protein